MAASGTKSLLSSPRPLPPVPPAVGPSVAHIAVLVPDDPQEVEAEGQQGGAQQVPQRRQVRNGEAVGVFAALPHGVDHPVRDAQQQQHLAEEEEEEEEVGTKVEDGNVRIPHTGYHLGWRSCFDWVGLDSVLVQFNIKDQILEGLCSARFTVQRKIKI